MEFPFDIPKEHIRSFIMICSYLGEPVSLIEEKLNILFPVNPPKKTSIYKWANAVNNGRISFEDAPRAGRPVEHTDLCKIVQEIIEAEPFQSVRSISSQLGVNRETVRLILTNELHLHKFKCKWIPYTLTPQRMRDRVLCATDMVRKLKNWSVLENTVTGDEAWFFFDNPADGQWAKSADEVQRNVNRTIQSKKVMLTILWGLNDFYVVEALPGSQKFDSEYFSSLLEMLKKKYYSSKKKKKIDEVYLHLDNAKVHTSMTTVAKAKELGFKILKHPSYSPDIAPSDFFLFGYIKDQLKNTKFETVDELIEEIHKILSQITYEMRKSVFEHWVERLEEVITKEGGYIED